MNNKPWKCVHCSRNMGDRVPHRCRGGFRKRNLVFIDRRTGTTYEKKWVQREGL